MSRPTFTLLLALSLASCGGGAAQSTTTSTTSHEETASSGPVLTPPPRPWAELSHDERRAHMVQHVLPATSELFTSWRSDHYADFGCETCHGADAASREFAMPNPSILTLYPTGTVGQEEVLHEYTDACTFMYSRLLPSVRTLVGAREYDPATHEGFTCFSCHPSAAADDPRNVPAHAE
jgi:hypothetical protein